jgi:hypothetical protein
VEWKDAVIIFAIQQAGLNSWDTANTYNKADNYDKVIIVFVSGEMPYTGPENFSI